MPWYSAGTVSVTNNSATVTGTGTAFSANARVGDGFRGPDGRWYEVTNIASATVLSIAPAYQGESESGAYAIAPLQGYVKESADRLRRVVDEFGTILSELGDNGPLLKIDAIGPLNERDQYDSANAGFTYFANDTELLYLKLSSTTGDWSAGAPIAQGPKGDKGDTGDVTPEAVAARDAAQAAAGDAADSAQAAADSAAAAEQQSIAAQQAAHAVAGIGAGWTPVLAVVSDGERRVLRVDDWTGGASNKPATGQYVGAGGFVADIADAIDVRGQPGAGSVESVSGVLPDANGNIDLSAADVGALGESATAVDSDKLGGSFAADFFQRSNILGTVSHSAGVPTGAVIERGSNSNGDYTKFADGTMICTTNVTTAAITEAFGGLFRSGVTSFNFPAAFIAKPALSVSCDTSGLAWASGRANSTTSGQANLWYPASIAGSNAVQIIIIGRWY